MSGVTMKHVSGITGAGPLFHRILSLAMDRIEKPAPLYDAPLEEREICALSGELASSHCPSTVGEKFAPGTAPRAQCSMHGAQGVDLGPRFYDCPREGDQFLRQSDLPDAFQTSPVRALAPRGGGPLLLQLDAGPRVELRSPFSGRIPAGRGRHTLRLFRPGRTEPDASASFTVDG
jgi:penicillin-binding protein 1C